MKYVDGKSFDRNKQVPKQELWMLTTLRMYNLTTYYRFYFSVTFTFVTKV